ncbi:MAG: site-specific DNA-methyltransferase [Planctomycetaceae bacterium]|jgi:site-specific DNA-methyltransferase (adenine-specific)|nr:site-specific DNA-methyltransferase [Planctomycetaceae bacterium]
MSEIEIICGNSLFEMRKMSDESVDLVIADPPYNLGKEYGNLSDCQCFTEYLDFMRQWLNECKRILRKDGTIYVFVGFRMISYVYQILERELKMNFVNWICWHYTQGIGKTKGFSPRHDDILMFTRSHNYYFNLDAVRIPQKYYRSINNMRGANPGDVWEFSHVHYCNGNRQQHPTQKPEGLIERMILASSDCGGVVLDPFAGSGTTPRVCQQTNRNCIGIEINPQYVKIIKQRLKNPFIGFDSIDPRMERVPSDLNDPQLRKEYLENHVDWFLGNHQNQEPKFWSDVAQKYNLPVAKRAKLNKKTMQTLLKIDE